MSRVEAVAPTQENLASASALQNQREENQREENQREENRREENRGGQNRGNTRQLIHPGFIFSGVLIALAVALGHWFLPEAYIVDSLGIIGGLLGGVYAGMGLVNPDTRKRWLQLLMALVIAGCAFAGVWVSPVFFALACFAHAGWDVVTGHPKCLNFPLVNWYVPLCLGYDVLFGVCILVWWSL